MGENLRDRVAGQVSVRAVDSVRSRVVLVGTPAYRDEELPDVPQVSANLADLGAVFTDPQLGGFPEQHCVTVPAKASMDEVGAILEQAAEQAEDLLLLYYAGHGILSGIGELYLSLYHTRFRSPTYSALRFETVRGTFLDSRAANRVVIIDSCFSGRAIGPALGPNQQAVLEQLEINGTYTLASAPPNRPAFVLPGEAHTAFTGRLLTLLREGSKNSGGLLSLGEIYRHLYARLRADGLPLPQARGTATADLLGLVSNRYSATAQDTVAPVALPEELRAGLDSRYPQVRAAAVEVLAGWLADADPGRVLAARSVLEEIAERDVPLVARVARDLAQRHFSSSGRALPTAPGRVIDLQRIGRLADEAERITMELAEEEDKAIMLSGLAQALVGSDPDRAERTAMTFAGERQRAVVLAAIANSLAGTDPQRANRLADEAERTTSAITNGLRKVWALAALVEALAGTDPDRAERIAMAIIDEHHKSIVLAGLVEGLAGTDADRAERTAMAINDKSYKSQALAALAKSLAGNDPDRAERTAMTITDERQRAVALAAIAKSLAGTDPHRAERLADEAERTALAITNKLIKVGTLLTTLMALAGNNAGQSL